MLPARSTRHVMPGEASVGRESSTSRGRAEAGGNAKLVLIAAASLALGALVYVLDRPAATAYLLPQQLSFAGPHIWFGALDGHLPEFVHVYAFILLTAALGPLTVPLWAICGFWWGLDSLFELGQHPALAPGIAAALPAWWQHMPLLDHTANYFLHGTFDPLDLLAIALGTLAAYFTVRFFQREVCHVPTIQVCPP